MTKQLGAYAALLFIAAYTVLSAPFVFLSYISFEARIALEFMAFGAIVVFITTRKIGVSVLKYILFFMILVLLLLIPAGEQSTAIRTSLVLIYFLLIASEASKLGGLSGLLTKSWFWFWLYVSFTVVAAFFAYQFDLVEFGYLDFGAVSETAGYNYYNNFLLGNVIKSRFLDYSVPRICWYVYEPGFLAFFFGINVIIAESVYTSFKYGRLFAALNFAAGTLTFSTTFIIFFLGWYLYRLTANNLGKNSTAAFAIFSATLLCGAYLIMANDILSYSSLDDRLLRINIALDIANSNSVFSFLFGNGIGTSSIVAGRGISAGILSIFIERGLVTLVFLGFIFYKYAKSNKQLLVYVLFFNLSFELVWYPAFFVALYIVYATSRSGPQTAGSPINGTLAGA